MLIITKFVTQMFIRRPGTGHHQGPGYRNFLILPTRRSSFQYFLFIKLFMDNIKNMSPRFEGCIKVFFILGRNTTFLQFERMMDIVLQ
ncbi:hypothetical protein FHW36_105461 [Chitinophaga polysaccharea]|uniref:Uncharacterized protein n=1 Tax=Chitinophaga polysaccharea TaxID=1293035 RepID=A0A561PPJ5_9BACT|nr:hypothetical protein FHW36_105461 [Chitinophaga polysaccharea]